jgi:phage gp29-like protein
LYPIVKFRRRAIESYVLYGDRYATPTAIAKAPLSASNVEIDTLYDHLSNLSQETAMILPEGYELEFLNPAGSADIFMNLIEYIDKEISLLVCGEDEAGQAEAGSRASSQVANLVRVIRASELAQLISQTLSDTLIRWIVDLNFGVNVEAPRISRQFNLEESTLTMADVSLMIQSGYKPKKEWIQNHFKVDLAEEEDFEAAAPQTEDAPEPYNPETDGDLYEKIFGGEGEGAPETEMAPGEEAPEDASAKTPEEMEAEGQLEEPAPVIEDEGEETPPPPQSKKKKPFGKQKITEDEAVTMADEEG